MNGIIEFFIADPSQNNRGLVWAYLLVLCLIGALLFSKFIYSYDASLYFHDWTDVTLPRLTFLKDAVSTGQLPLHSGTPLFLGNIRSTRYLAIPDAMFSPQIMLLKWLSVYQFIPIHVILMYAIGFLGLLVLQRKFKLSLLTFSIVTALYFFNGNILAHLSVGHLTFASYFLFSWFALLIFNLLNGECGWKWVAQMAGLLFFMLLQGGYHQVVWCLIFMGFLAIFAPSKFWDLTKAAATAVLLGAVRLLPEISLLASFNTTFLGGYSNVWSIWTNLVAIVQPGTSILIENTQKKIGLWEMTLFIGVVGAVFMLYFGMVRPFLRKNTGAAQNHKPVIASILGIVLLSMHHIYRFLQMLLPLPLFLSERVASRMISVAFVFILILAAIEFQIWLNSRTERGFSLGLILIIIAIGLNDLYQNYLTWKVTQSSIAFPAGDFRPDNWFVANNFSDTPYINLLILGLVISTMTLVFLAAMLWRDKHANIRASRQI